jgi:hypothetical protein
MHFLLVSLFLIATSAATSPVQAQDGYDNPSLGSAPCLVLKSYRSTVSGETFGADATVENICGRSIEVAFCFPYLAPAEEAESHCVNGMIRPRAAAAIEVEDLPAQLSGPDYKWRYLPITPSS